MKRRIAIALIFALIAGILSCPLAMADERYTASTGMADASDGNRENIALACAAINGIRVGYGDSFSFNDVVGPRTRSAGYVEAENARGVEVTGGGVAQVATTLYLALLRMGDQIEYTQLSTYGKRFSDSYVSDGSKAVLTDYSSGKDFAFVNRAGDMTIEMWTSDSALNCAITLDEGSGDDWFGEPVDGDGQGASNAHSARIPCGDDPDTLENVRLAAQSVYGTVIHKGELFSFNEIVGPRTAKEGYVSGINGRGADVTGGGVAQVASVVWLAVKDLEDVSIVEKSTYGKRYNQDYVESASDAILTDYKAGRDFSFRYNGPVAITIDTYIEDGYLVCDVSFG